MIESYFAEIEATIQAFPNIRTYNLHKKIHNQSQGYIGGTLVFSNGCQLDFIEVKNVDFPNKIKYRYQYMDENQTLVFCHDNAPHHKHIPTFPHHEHIQDDVIASPEPTIRDVLLKIAQLERDV